jgi:hypothetical protein
MSPIEIIAALFAAVTLIKLITISIKPGAWSRNIAKPIISNPISKWIYLGLGLWYGNYLLRFYSIVELFAIGALFAMFIGWEFMYFPKEMDTMMTSLMKKAKGNFWKKYPLMMAFWVVIALWVLKELFL